MHADHHLGTTSMIKAWSRAMHGDDSEIESEIEIEEKQRTDRVQMLAKRKLLVVSNPYMAKWLQEYSSVENFGYKHIAPLKTVYTSDQSTISPLIWDTNDVGFMTAKADRLYVHEDNASKPF